MRVLLASVPLAFSMALGAAQPPDFSGFWMLERRQPETDAQLAPHIPANTVVVRDSGATEFGLMDFGGLKLKPAALAAAKAWDPKSEMTISNACKIPSIVYAMQGPFPIEIMQGSDIIVMRLEYFDLARAFFFNPRFALPPDGPHSKTGNSIAHWEGDQLVVVTTHLKSATITNNGLEHSDNVKVIERFRLADGGKRLIATQEFEDPEVLDNRGVRFISWRKVAGDHVTAYDCDPSIAVNYAQ
jgi:hypothetical protein